MSGSGRLLAATVTMWCCLVSTALGIGYDSHFGGPGTGAGRFFFNVNDTAGIAVEADGDLVVADGDNRRLQVFSPTGTHKLSILGNDPTHATAGNELGEIGLPLDVAVHPVSGRIYVADQSRCRILVFEATGAFAFEFGTCATTDGNFAYVSGVAIAADGSVYTADYSQSRISKFSDAGLFLYEFQPGTGGAEGLMSGTTDVDVRAGLIYAAEYSNGRVKRLVDTGSALTLAGSPVNLGSSGTGTGQFTELIGVAAGGDGRLYATDSTAVEVFDAATGAHLRTLTTCCSGSSMQPQGVVHTAGGIHVADYTGNRVVRFSNQAPLAGFTVSPAPAAPNATITLTSTAADGDGALTASEWDLDNDGVYDDASGPSATVSFPAAGSYTVGLKVTDDELGTDTETKQVTVALPVEPTPTPTPSPSPTPVPAGSPSPIASVAPTPLPEVDRSPPSGTFTTPGARIRVTDVSLVAGLELALTCTEACAPAGQVLIATRTAKALKVKGLVAGTVRAKAFGAAKYGLVVQLEPAVAKAFRRARARTLAATVVVTLKDAAGNTAELERELTVSKAPCESGAVRFVINQKPRCAVAKAPRTVAPAATPDPASRALEGFLLADPVGRALQRASKRRGAIPQRTALVKRTLGKGGAKALVEGMAAIGAAVPRARARVAAAPKVNVTANEATGAYTVSGSVPLPDGSTLEVSGRGNGKTGEGEVGIGGTKRLDATREMRVTRSTPINSVPSCPGVDGALSGTDGVELKITIIEYAKAGSRTVKEANTRTVRFRSSLDAEVGDDAYVSRATIDFSVEISDVTSFRRGPLAGRTSSKLTFQANATVSPAAMRAGAAQPYTVNRSAASLAGAFAIGIPGVDSAEAVNLLKSQVGAAFEQLIADRLKSNTDQLRRKEEGWRTPNTCVQVEYTPPSGAELGPARTLPVSVYARHPGAGQYIPATFTRLAAPRGSAEPASVPRGTKDGGRITVMGAAGTKPEQESARFTYRATSRSGIGEGEWSAKAPKLRPLFLRFTGYSSLMTSATDNGTRRVEVSLTTPSPVFDFANDHPCQNTPDTDPCSVVMKAQGRQAVDGSVWRANPPCSFTYPHFENVSPLQVTVRMAFPDGPAPVVLISSPTPSVGDVSDGTCGAYAYADMDLPAEVALDRDKLLAGEPVTAVLDRNGVTPATSATNTGQPITWRDTRAFTVRRVNADGTNYVP